MSTTTHQLISAATFRSMVKRGARSSDLDHVQIFKSGTILAPPGEPESRDVPLILSNSKRDRRRGHDQRRWVGSHELSPEPGRALGPPAR